MDVLESHQMQGLPPSAARRLFLDVLSGLEHLHHLGIAHRDLSLENILFNPETQSFSLIDLGMCLRLPKDELTGEYAKIPRRKKCGKHNYMAPEIWSGSAYFDPLKVDIWAAGVILFMILTGAAPMAQAVPSDPHYQLICEKQRLLDVLIAAKKFATSEMPVLDEETLLAMDLVRRMLTADPDQRISLEEIFHHPYMHYSK